jgi:hypothetical protein
VYKGRRRRTEVYRSLGPLSSDNGPGAGKGGGGRRHVRDGGSPSTPTRPHQDDTRPLDLRVRGVRAVATLPQFSRGPKLQTPAWATI